MNRFAPPHATQRPPRPVGRQTNVCVVDPRTDDYSLWRDAAETHGLQLTFLATADEALRHSRTQAVDLWVVNTELAGLSGFELCGMLKARSAHTAVYLVADAHSPATERAAWASRATVYTCKPAHADLLEQWWQRRCQPTHSLPCVI